MDDPGDWVEATFSEKLHVLRAGGAVLCSKLQLQELFLLYFDSKRRVSCVSQAGGMSRLVWAPNVPGLYMVWLQELKEVRDGN